MKIISKCACGKVLKVSNKNGTLGVESLGTKTDWAYIASQWICPDCTRIVKVHVKHLIDILGPGENITLADLRASTVDFK